MKSKATKRLVTATAEESPLEPTSVALTLRHEGVSDDLYYMTKEEARELAEQLLKASGIKFTLKF